MAIHANATYGDSLSPANSVSSHSKQMDSQKDGMTTFKADRLLPTYSSQLEQESGESNESISALSCSQILELDMTYPCWFLSTRRGATART